MINTGGFCVAMVAAFLTHCDAYCMSDFNEEKLLSAIDRVKVIEQKQMCYNFFYLTHL